MRVLIKVVNSDSYEVEKNKDYETVMSEIHLAQKDKLFYEFKDVNSRKITLNVNHIVSVVEEKEKPKVKPMGVQGIPRRR